MRRQSVMISPSIVAEVEDGLQNPWNPPRVALRLSTMPYREPCTVTWMGPVEAMRLARALARAARDARAKGRLARCDSPAAQAK